MTKSGVTNKAWSLPSLMMWGWQDIQRKTVIKSIDNSPVEFSGLGCRTHLGSSDLLRRLKLEPGLLGPFSRSNRTRYQNRWLKRNGKRERDHWETKWSVPVSEGRKADDKPKGTWKWNRISQSSGDDLRRHLTLSQRLLLDFELMETLSGWRWMEGFGEEMEKNVDASVESGKDYWRGMGSLGRRQGWHLRRKIRISIIFMYFCI